MWGLGVLGLSRYEYYTSTLSELYSRMKGFMIREAEIKQIGSRRIATFIHNGFSALGGGSQHTEKKIWPMSIDKWMGKDFRKDLEKSEDIVKKEADFIKKYWPDVKI